MSRGRILSLPQTMLLVLLVALVAIWLKLGSSKRGTTGGDSSAPLQATFPADSVSEIEIERGGWITRVVREGEEYWLVDPYRDRANGELVAQSIHIASTLRPLRVLPDTISGPFGLDRPASIWRCRWPHGAYSIVIGDSLPGGGGRYARRSGSAEIVILDDFLTRRYIAPSIRSLHDPVAAQLRVGPVDSVLVATREEEIVIVRRRTDLWEIVAPFQGEASAPEVIRGIQSLRGAEVRDFLGPAEGLDLRTLGLDPPRATWTLIQGSLRARVRIGNPTADQKSVRIIPAGRDVVCLIDSETFRTWVDGLKRLRDSRIFRADADTLVRITVRGGRGQRTFARSGNRGWVEVARTDTLDLRQGAIEQAAANLCAVQATGFGAVWPAASDRVLHIGLVFRDGSRDSIEVAPPRRGEAALRATRLSGPCAVAGVFYETWLRWLERPPRE